MDCAQSAAHPVITLHVGVDPFYADDTVNEWKSVREVNPLENPWHHTADSCPHRSVHTRGKKLEETKVGAVVPVLYARYLVTVPRCRFLGGAGQ
jgi:hypothetical protein